MDTAINLLAGGLHVRVLHEGQKITDENTTLAQIGVTCQESLDTLEFMLEPNCNHNALVKLDEPLPLLSNVMDQPTKSWYASKNFQQSMFSDNGFRAFTHTLCE
jgi:hypothetical protein